MNNLRKLYKETLILSDAKNLILKRGYKFNVDVPWVKPEKKPFYHPDKTGDLKSFELPESSCFRLNVEKSEEFKR